MLAQKDHISLQWFQGNLIIVGWQGVVQGNISDQELFQFDHSQVGEFLRAFIKFNRKNASLIATILEYRNNRKIFAPISIYLRIMEYSRTNAI